MMEPTLFIDGKLDRLVSHRIAKLNPKQGRTERIAGLVGREKASNLGKSEREMRLYKPQNRPEST